MRNRLSLLLSIALVSVSSLSYANLATVADQPKRFFFTAEGSWIKPNENRPLQTFAQLTQISNQRINNQWGYAFSGGVTFKKNLFVRLNYRHISPVDKFHINSTTLLGVQRDLDFTEKWNFNFWHLDVGKMATISDKIKVSGYVGISYFKSQVEALASKSFSDGNVGNIQKERLHAAGYGPRIGAETEYRLMQRCSLIGGFDTTFLYTSFINDSAAALNLPYKKQWGNYHTNIPLVDAFVGANMRFNSNFSMQAGMRAFHSFGFNPDGLLTMYKDYFLVNGVAWSGPYISVTFKF